MNLLQTINLSSKRLFLLAILALFLFPTDNFAQPKKSEFMGVKLRTEVQRFVDEIEEKTGNKIVGLYTPFDAPEEESVLGVSFIHSDGIAYIGIKDSLEGQTEKLEAVIAHELLHLRLRVRGFPVFLWSPTVKTQKGLAQDVEQSNANDLLSLIEHHIFKAEMEKLGLYKILDLAKDSIQGARDLKGTEDGQAEAINFCRAVLEFQNLKDLETLRKVFIENGWQNSIKVGEAMANIIKAGKLTNAAQVQAVFSSCLIKLYNTPRAFKFRRDAEIKSHRRMIIGV